MPRPILVGYDPASADRAPVEFGIAAARFTGAPLVVACACADRERPDEDLPERAEDVLLSLKLALRGDALPIEYREVVGASAARALHRAAEELEAGLLIVGSSRRGAIGRVLPGSTAERLMHGAPTPIAVVPRGWTRGGGLHTIGVAYMDSDEAREALAAGHALARVAGATLRVLTVVRPPRVGVQRGRSAADIEAERLSVAEQSARAAIEGLADGVNVEVEGFAAEPADTLIRISEHLDLLVCGSRGYGPLRAVVLGGVSRRVTGAALCPVLVLPRGVPGALEGLLATPSDLAAPR